MIRNFGNKLGLAWWAKIETQQPDATYWFGPFITKRSLNDNISSFIKDLSDEGSRGSLRGKTGDPNLPPPTTVPCY